MKNGYEIEPELMNMSGPFKEFKQDAFFVSVELNTGDIFEHVLILYPNKIIAMKGMETLPFEPKNIVRVFQSEKDKCLRSSSNWKFWL